MKLDEIVMKYTQDESEDWGFEEAEFEDFLVDKKSEETKNVLGKVKTIINRYRNETDVNQRVNHVMALMCVLIGIIKPKHFKTFMSMAVKVSSME